MREFHRSHNIRRGITFSDMHFLLVPQQNRLFDKNTGMHVWNVKERQTIELWHSPWNRDTPQFLIHPRNTKVYVRSTFDGDEIPADSTANPFFPLETSSHRVMEKPRSSLQRIISEVNDAEGRNCNLLNASPFIASSGSFLAFAFKVQFAPSLSKRRAVLCWFIFRSNLLKLHRIRLSRVCSVLILYLWVLLGFQWKSDVIVNEFLCHNLPAYI